MNQKIDTSETLRIQETEEGHTLIIIKQEEIKLKIKDGKVLNNLSKRQLEFVKDSVIYGKLIQNTIK